MQKIEETVGNGAAAQQLGEAEVIRLVDETAKILLDWQELKTETEIWVRRGKVIRAYVRALQPDGKYHKPDPYVLLAEHPDIRWSADQLRNFVDAVNLWEQIGEGQPSLPVTFYAVVASGKGSFEEKKALLLKAAAEGLTTREVKRKAAGKPEDAEGESDGTVADGGRAGESDEVTKPNADWKKVGAYAEKLYGEISGVSDADLPDLDIIKKLREVAAKITALLAKFEKGPRK